MRILTLIIIFLSIQTTAIASDTPDVRNGMNSWTSVTVSVKSIDLALDLWVKAFGLDVEKDISGADTQLAALWDIPAGDIKRQVLLRTPGSQHGKIHLVEFDQPGEAVRDGANVFDKVPKNLDVYVSDMPTRLEELKTAGYQFSQDTYSEITAPDGTLFREIHMPSHDAVNVVLLEVPGKELPFTAQGYAGVGPLITIVGDALSERKFYENIIGLNMLNDNILEGPEIERMIGLPSGSSLNVSIWGNEKDALGQVEVIEYRGAQGNNLYPRTVPKYRGILRITYETPDLQKLTSLLDEAHITWDDKGIHNTLQGNGHFIRFQSPAGLRIDTFERQ